VCVRVAGLQRDVKVKLYGQHLAADVILRLVEGHVDNEHPSKALVLSFHGTTGVGKNYVSKMIVDRLYRRGSDSNFVKQFIATVDFQSSDAINSYKVCSNFWAVADTAL